MWLVLTLAVKVIIPCRHILYKCIHHSKFAYILNYSHVDFLPCVQVLQTEVAYWAVDTQELSAHEQSFPTFRAFPDDSSIHFYGLRAHEHPGLCKVWCLEALLSPFTSSLTVEMCSHGKNQ